MMTSVVACLFLLRNCLSYARLACYIHPRLLSHSLHLGYHQYSSCALVHIVACRIDGTFQGDPEHRHLDMQVRPRAHEQISSMHHVRPFVLCPIEFALFLGRDHSIARPLFVHPIVTSCTSWRCARHCLV